MRTLSGGQKQRLSLACALVGGPELLFLDEPTTGLDPQSRRQTWDIVEEFKARGRTVLLTTHYMEEAARLCDRVAVVDHGKVIALGTPRELIASLGAEHVVEFAVAAAAAPATRRCPALPTRGKSPVTRAAGGSRSGRCTARCPPCSPRSRRAARADPAHHASRHAGGRLHGAHRPEPARWLSPRGARAADPLLELTLARIRELIREPEAVFWVFVFPILLTGILGLAFRSRPPDALPVAVVEGPHAEARAHGARGRSGSRPALSEAEARQALARGRSCWWCPPTTRPSTRTIRPSRRAGPRGWRWTPRCSGRRARRRVHARHGGGHRAGRPLRGLPGAGPPRHEPDGHGHVGHRLLAGGRAQRQPAQAADGGAGPPQPYPGRAALLAAHLPGAGGRRAAALRALRPGRAAAGFGVPAHRVSLLGALAFSGLGLLTAARPRTIEGVSGLMNLVMVPMWIFSGIFFSTERFPAESSRSSGPASHRAQRCPARGHARGRQPGSARPRAGPPRPLGRRQLRHRPEDLPLAVGSDPRLWTLDFGLT